MDDRVWLPVLTYTLNLFPNLLGVGMGHTWSLCVEEHFYLLWPLALVLLGRPSAPWFLLSLVLSAPVLRFVLDTVSGFPNVRCFTLTRLDTIAVGCLFAYWVHSRHAGTMFRAVRGRGNLVAIASCVFFLASVLLSWKSHTYSVGPKALLEAAAIWQSSP